MKPIKYGAILIPLLVSACMFSGCSTVNGPRVPKALDFNGSSTNLSTAAFQTNLKEYSVEMNKKTTVGYTNATFLRDQMINSIRVEIEMNYRSFEQNLYSGRASFNTAADITELALAGAATITHGEQAKTVISAVLLAAKGSRLSYDKNFFREKTTEAIIASMQSERSKKLTQIINGMGLNAEKYPFEQAWVDLVDFFYAGTIEGGLLALTSDAGNNAVTNKTILQESEKQYFNVKRITR